MTQFKMIRSEIELDVIAPAGRIGLIALATDFNSEQDLRRMLPNDVEIFTNRSMNANPLTVENLRKITADISRAASGIIPGVKLDAIIYGCTSSTVVNGAEKIAELVHQSQPGIPVTDPLSAVLNALAHLKIKRLSILTPYLEEINREMVTLFSSQGIEVTRITGLGYESDIDITGIPATAIVKAAIASFDKQTDGLFISCTALRASMAIEDIETAIGKPVISSNQGLVWHCLKLLGYDRNIKGFGQLLRS